MIEDALAPPLADGQATPAASGRQPRLRKDCGCVASEHLFRGARELIIEHNGETYHLRITRNEKLILTK